MAGKSFLIDTSKCMGCRACQVACKSWNQNPAEATVQRGTYQNPADLSYTTYKLVRFNEVEADGELRWYFFPDQCRHCVEPPCRMMAEASGIKGAITQDKKTGAVLYDQAKARQLPKGLVDEMLGCPCAIPRAGTRGSVAKCTMCIDRVSNGLLPACVSVCPTGAMSFGDRDKILSLGKKRLAELKKDYPKAQLLDPKDVRSIYLVLDEPKKYHEFAKASPKVKLATEYA